MRSLIYPDREKWTFQPFRVTTGLALKRRRELPPGVPGRCPANRIGKTRSGRYVFLVFPLRTIRGRALIRPISARYMHKKEVIRYENSSAQKDAISPQ